MPKPHPKQDIHPERPRWEILFLIFAHFFGAFFRKAETHKKKKNTLPLILSLFPQKPRRLPREGGGVLRQTDKSRCPKMRKSLPGLTETEAGRQEELEEKKNHHDDNDYIIRKGVRCLILPPAVFPGNRSFRVFPPSFLKVGGGSSSSSKL